MRTLNEVTFRMDGHSKWDSQGTICHYLMKRLEAPAPQAQIREKQLSGHQQIWWLHRQTMVPQEPHSVFDVGWCAVETNIICGLG